MSEAPVRYPNSRSASVSVRMMLVGERRLDSEVYLSDGFQFRAQIESLSGSVTVSAMARVWQPGRLKGIRVGPDHGVPFLAATQAFDIRPTPRKWLSELQTPDIDERFVDPGTLLLTCSGNVADAVMSYRPHVGKIISHDLLRIEPKEKRLAAYLYTFCRTRHGRAVMQSSQYGNIIKHLEPEHLDTVPVPRFDSALDEELAADISAVYGWRDEAFGLEADAEAQYASAVGVTVTASLDDTFDVSARALFAGRRRLDGYHFNAVGRQIAEGLPNAQPLADTVERVVLPQRFTRRFDNGGTPFIGSEDVFKVNPPITKFLHRQSMRNPADYLVEPGWLLLARSGQIYGTNGNVILANEWHAGKIVSEHVIRIVPKRVRSGYLSAALGHPTLGHPLVIREAFGTSIPEIDPLDLSAIPVARIGQRAEDEIAEKMEVASALRNRAATREDAAVARLEQRIEAAIGSQGTSRRDDTDSRSGRVRFATPSHG